jgi:4-carboxymuconolactone decarboxylase
MGGGCEISPHSGRVNRAANAIVDAWPQACLSTPMVTRYGRRATAAASTHRKETMSQDRAARGKKIRDEAFGKDGLKTWDELNAICPTHARAIHEYCFGTIWDRPHLDLKTRELIVIAAAAASDCPNEVALHARGALNRGAKREEIIETILQCAPYVGFPKTNHALKAAKDVFDRWETKKDDWKAL